MIRALIFTDNKHKHLKPQTANVTLFALVIFALLPGMSQPAFAQNYVTLGYRTCGTGQNNCHVSEGDWWKKDPHYETIRKLKSGGGNRSKQISQLYGLQPNDFLKGDSPCAVCHGEVTEKRKTRLMNTGVSCESCHGPSGPEKGPAAGYFKIHQVGEKSAGPGKDTKREGYRKGLQAGMRKLYDPATRARECVRCHYINEKKLLETGHPTGETFNYVRGIENTVSKHWEYEIRTVDLDNSFYEREKQKRGPIPEFTVKNLAIAPPASTAAEPIIIYRDRTQPPWLNPDNTIAIEPFEPQVSDTTSVESMLLQIKRYIDYVHESIRNK